MKDNTQELDEIEKIIRSVLTPNSYIVPQEGIELTKAILDWHNKQVESIVEATYDNLPSLDKLTVGNEMSDGYDQGVEAFRLAMTEALYGKETN